MGGLVKVEHDQAVRLGELPDIFNQHWYWIFTGTPATSTGVCVERVRTQFEHSDIWSEFAAVTHRIEAAQTDLDQLSLAIQDNHRLLNRIGVVPARVTALIEQIERLGGAAKIAGAGAVSGDAGGLVLACLPNQTPDALKLPNFMRWGRVESDGLGVSLGGDL
jgi:mevalonate kinase